MPRDPDRIVFPGQEDVEDAEDMGEMEDRTTTVAMEEPVPTQLSSVGLALIVLCLTGVILLSLLLYWRWRRRRKLEKEKEKKEELGKLSFTGTLGSTYNHVHTFPETESLMSSRKSSTITTETLEKVDTDQTDFGWDPRVSRFIDGSAVDLGKGGEEDGPRLYGRLGRHGYGGETTFGEVLEEGRDGSNLSLKGQPPLAPSEEFHSNSSFSMCSSLPQSTHGASISIIGDSGGMSVSRPISRIVEDTMWEPSTPPTVTVLPPTPRERPRSYVDSPPALPSKQRLAGAISELQVHTVTAVPPSSTGSRSDSHLANLPPVPPKSKPYLPPKQTIGKSKEDLERINKELLRSSSQVSSSSPVPTEDPGTDQDYDFPSHDTGDQEDYDEPQPVLPDSYQLPSTQNWEPTHQQEEHTNTQQQHQVTSYQELDCDESPYN